MERQRPCSAAHAAFPTCARRDAPLHAAPRDAAEATGAVVAAGLAAVSAPQPALAARASDEDDEAPQRREFHGFLKKVVLL